MGSPFLGLVCLSIHVDHLEDDRGAGWGPAREGDLTLDKVTNFSVVVLAEQSLRDRTHQRCRDLHVAGRARLRRVVAAIQTGDYGPFKLTYAAVLGSLARAVEV